MERTWQTATDAGRPTWWTRHWANPNFSGSLIAIVCVLLVMATGLIIAAQTLHLTWADLDLARVFHS